LCQGRSSAVAWGHIASSLDVLIPGIPASPRRDDGLRHHAPVVAERRGPALRAAARSAEPTVGSPPAMRSVAPAATAA
jgi:hypothetical protein